MNKVKENPTFRGEYTLVIRKPDGTAKELFQYNALGFWLLKTFGVSLDIPFLTGNWSTSFKTSNLIVNDGLVAAVGTSGVNPFSYIALGTDDTSPTNSDSSLGAELSSDGLSRTQGTVSQVTTNITNDTHQVKEEFTYTGSTAVSIEELGAFDAASSGTMFSRTLTGGKQVDTNGEIVDVTYQVVASRA